MTTAELDQLFGFIDSGFVEGDYTEDPDPWSPAEIAGKAKEDMEDAAERFERDAWA